MVVPIEISMGYDLWKVLQSMSPTFQEPATWQGLEASWGPTSARQDLPSLLSDPSQYRICFTGVFAGNVADGLHVLRRGVGRAQFWCIVTRARAALWPSSWPTCAPARA